MGRKGIEEERKVRKEPKGEKIKETEENYYEEKI
jgi:hypothetical protein